MITTEAFRKIVFLYQVVLAGAGAAIAILSLSLLVTSPIQALSPKTVLVSGLVLGIILVFVSALGIIGSRDERRQPALIGYAVLMVGVIGVTLWGVISLSTDLHEDKIQLHLDNIWLDSDVNTVLQIQTWGQCCGFNSYSDRIQEPCTRYDPEVGCFELMKIPYQARLTSMLVPATMLLVAECVGLALNILILWLAWNDGRQAKLIGERQPFEAWHKAVFH